MGRPRFKKRSIARRAARFAENAFSIRGGWKNTGPSGGRLHLAKVGNVPVNWHRPLPGYPSAVAVREDRDGRWWASFVVRVPMSPPKRTTRQPRAAGVDVGLTDYAAIVYSDGTREKIANPRFLRKALRRIARLNRKRARCAPGSKNREKARRALARAHSRVARLRENHARQLASKLTRENQAVCVETLNIRGLARTRLARSVNDAGWGQFLRFLEEACHRKGVLFIKAPAGFPSSRCCSVCGVNSGKKPLSVRA